MEIQHRENLDSIQADKKEKNMKEQNCKKMHQENIKKGKRLDNTTGPKCKRKIEQDEDITTTKSHKISQNNTELPEIDNDIKVEEDCKEIDYYIVFLYLLILLFCICTSDKDEVSTQQASTVPCQVSTHSIFHNCWYCHKCNKLVCSGNVKDHIEYNLVVTSTSAKISIFLPKASFTIAQMELLLNPSHKVAVFAGISKKVCLYLKMYLNIFKIYEKFYKVFKAIKIYFKNYCTHNFKQLIIIEKISSKFKPDKNNLKFSAFQLQSIKKKLFKPPAAAIKKLIQLIHWRTLALADLAFLKTFLNFCDNYNCKISAPAVLSNAANSKFYGSQVLVTTAWEITWFNGIVCKYQIKNGECFITEMVDSSKVSIRHKKPCLVINFKTCTDLTPERTASSLFNASILGYSKTITNILIPEVLHSSLKLKTFYTSYLYNCLLPNNATESRPLHSNKYSQLTVATHKIFFRPHIVTGLDKVHHQELTDVAYATSRPFGKQITSATKTTDQCQQTFPSQGNPYETGGMSRENDHTVGKHGDIQLPYDGGAAVAKYANKSLEDAQVEGSQMPVSKTSLPTSHMEKDTIERDGQSSLPAKVMPKQSVSEEVEKDGKIPMSSGIDQATPISSSHLEQKLIGSITAKPSHNVDHNPLGAHIVKGSSKETEVLPTVGPQHNTMYNTKLDDEVQISHEEVRHKGNTRTTFYQHEFEHHAYNPKNLGDINFPKNPPINEKVQIKLPEVKKETNKTSNDFKPKPLPKRSCIVCGDQQYPLVNNLISHPHMDHYFVKERTEIKPSHYLAKLVLHHQYLNRDDVNDDTMDITAAKKSQAAVLVADSVVEKDGAVTERRHFPKNLNMPGFVVFSSDLTRFTGNVKYPLPSRKATAVKIGKGGNGFVFAIFHNGKEYAVKKTVYRPNEIRIHSQLAHPNLVNLDAVIIGEEHEKHKGKFYAFCFMTKCDMDFRSVISTKEHGCLKHLKLQLSKQRDVWQLVMVNVKYVLRSVLKALDYMHKLGLVHRDVKASNVLLKMQCSCSKPLMCACPQKYFVKLGDFDSSTTVPGYGLKIEPHQMIRYASVLPLGTMGYRAPEVAMHLVIAGPYEVLYTTAVDIWSFGCLLLNLLIGKCGPLKQRGEAALLLSTQDQPYAEPLYNQIIKIKELQKYYGDIPEMADLVRKCLQVEVHCRPSAKQLLQLDVLQCI